MKFKEYIIEQAAYFPDKTGWGKETDKKQTTSQKQDRYCTQCGGFIGKRLPSSITRKNNTCDTCLKNQRGLRLKHRIKKQEDNLAELKKKNHN